MWENWKKKKLRRFRRRTARKPPCSGLRNREEKGKRSAQKHDTTLLWPGLKLRSNLDVVQGQTKKKMRWAFQKLRGKNSSKTTQKPPGGKTKPKKDLANKASQKQEQTELSTKSGKNGTGPRSTP